MRFEKSRKKEAKQINMKPMVEATLHGAMAIPNFNAWRHARNKNPSHSSDQLD